MPSGRKLAAFCGPQPETFASIIWNDANRAEHEARRPKPRFEAARHADWSRLFQRKDVEHPGPPDRFQAFVGATSGPSPPSRSWYFPGCMTSWRSSPSSVPTMPNAKSSSASRLTRPRPASPRAVVPAPTLDQDALGFAERGRPEAEIGCSEDAPRLTPEQLAAFEPASIRFTQRGA